MLSASLSWTTTPSAANTSVTVPMMEAKMPSPVLPELASIVFTASLPLSPSRPRIAAMTSDWTAERSNTATVSARRRSSWAIGHLTSPDGECHGKINANATDYRVNAAFVATIAWQRSSTDCVAL